jgi:hypothetical protein
MLRTSSGRGSFVVAILAGLVFCSVAAAQLPGGLSMPGGLPTGGLSKDSLLQQAKALLSDLTSMKSSGKLAPEQTQQVDELLPKAQSLNDELEKPQLDTARLPQLASNLSDLQKQVGPLKALMK